MSGRVRAALCISKGHPDECDSQNRVKRREDRGVVPGIGQENLDRGQHHQAQRPRRVASPIGTDQRGDQSEEGDPVQDPSAEHLVQVIAVRRAEIPEAERERL